MRHCTQKQETHLFLNPIIEIFWFASILVYELQHILCCCRLFLIIYFLFISVSFSDEYF